LLIFSVRLFAEADRSTLTRGHCRKTLRRFAGLCPRDLLLLVTRYHDIWSIVSAFNKAPVIADVIADLRTVVDQVVCVTTAVATILRPARWPVGAGARVASRPECSAEFDPSVKHQVPTGFCQQNIESWADRQRTCDYMLSILRERQTAGLLICSTVRSDG
jgi:hypothetical protein